MPQTDILSINKCSDLSRNYLYSFSHDPINNKWLVCKEARPTILTKQPKKNNNTINIERNDIDA